MLHLLAVFTPLDRPGWLLRAPAEPVLARCVRATLRRVIDPYDRSWRRDVGGWLLHDLLARPLARLERACGVVRCPTCDGGVPCEVWEGVAIAGYVTRAKGQRRPPPLRTWVALAVEPRDLVAAARELGLTWPCDAAAVRAAHRACVAARHPDAGGNDATMSAANVARDQLLATLATR